MRMERLGIREIARRLGRSASTISREVRRNGYPTDGHYRPAHADKMARGRRKRSRKGTRFALKEWRRVEELIRLDYSPEQVSGFLRRHEELSISHETFYTYLWRDKQAGGCLHLH